MSLFDASANPPQPVSGASVTLAVGPRYGAGQYCTAVTDAAGMATCTVTPDTPGALMLTGVSSETAQFMDATCTTGFTVVAPLCPPTPVTGCQSPTPAKASLFLKAGTTAAKNQLSWQWSGVPVSVADFGDPTTSAYPATSTGYTLCVYDGAGLEMTAQMPAPRVCGTKPCWSPLGTLGFRYQDKTGTPDGVTKGLLKASPAGRGKILLKGKGLGLTLPVLPLSPPVRVQLQRSRGNGCWEATYDTAIKNTATAFKAKSE
jgi:hypothetical protein